MTTTGPFLTSVSELDRMVYRRWFRQRPPYPSTGRPPSEYDFKCAKVTRRIGAFATNNAGNSMAGYAVGTWVGGGKVRQRAWNNAYAKFRDSVNEEAMLLVNIAERKQAVSMITKNCDRMLFAFQLLQRGRRAEAMKALGLTPKGSKWNKPKDASGLWLEYHFGWSPLISDIGHACDILQSDWTTRIAKGTASDTSTEGSYFSSNPEYWSNITKIKVHVKMQARVRVKNPNLHRASQLGLINPASVAWELIPFSFLVDWFIPVGQFLNSWTDFVGLELENPFTTVFVTATSQEWMVNKYLGPSFLDANGAGMHRYLSIGGPVLHWQPPGRLSVTRAATSVALLLQVFNRQLKSDKTKMSLGF